ncbi:uncharacterized protein CDV56_100537 [Aspergillus thermomutatus]|uniref:Uncharacterized protein n=1 Tax=Aspergillus thermomutatus TaxID=41047 RepID=A0A397G2Y2_ASPTH|nr:uncharacterized protein CDV56_100537 [Aspergillus thermomutatus]RHZ43213.1 hypothetical protein CDV56_100537 [Aspergillus thermomutatus]
MSPTRPEKGPSYPATARQNAQSTTLLWRLHDLVDQIMVISGICAASLPIAYYLICYYYQGLDKATCRGRNSDLTIILGGVFIVAYLLKYVLRYYARSAADQ